MNLGKLYIPKIVKPKRFNTTINERFISLIHRRYNNKQTHFGGTYHIIYTGICTGCKLFFYGVKKRQSFCSTACSGRFSSRHLAPKGFLDTDGYFRVRRKGVSYKVHNLIMEMKIHRKLKKHEQVHHVNHDPRDNRIGNLILVKGYENQQLNSAVWKYIRTFISLKNLRQITFKALKDIRRNKCA